MPSNYRQKARDVYNDVKRSAKIHYNNAAYDIENLRDWSYGKTIGVKKPQPQQNQPQPQNFIPGQLQVPQGAPQQNPPQGQPPQGQPPQGGQAPPNPGQQGQQGQQQGMPQGPPGYNPYGQQMFPGNTMMNTYNFAKYRLKQNMLKVAILWILAILSAVSFGHFWFGAAIICYSIYVILPTEASVLLDAKKNATGRVWSCPKCGKDHGPAMLNSPPPVCPHGTQPITCTIRVQANMSGENNAKLMARAFFKIAAILFTIVDFGFFNPTNGILTVVVLFTLYFWLPLSYFTGRIASAMESWFRMLFVAPLLALSMIGFLSPTQGGSIIAMGFSTLVSNLPQFLISIIPLSFLIIIALAFGENEREDMQQNKYFKFTLAAIIVGVLYFVFIAPYFPFPGESAPQMAMFYLVLAFFMTAPNRKIGPESFQLPFQLTIMSNDINEIYSKIHGGKGTLWPVQSAMYWTFLIQAGAPVILSFTSGAPSELMFITAALWLLSALVGAPKGARTMRPYMGVMLIILSLILFSFQFTGTIGTAVFGQFWPSVYSSGKVFIEPIAGGFAAIGTTMEDYSLMVSCYDCWVAKQQQKKIDDAGKLKQGGTTRAIELESFEAVNYESKEPDIDPALPLVGQVVLKNKGEFDAANVKVYFDKLFVINPANVSAADSDEGKVDLSDDCKFTDCSGVLTPDGFTCIWDESALLPNDRIDMTFECGNPLTDRLNWSSGDKGIFNCKCAEYNKDDDEWETEPVGCDKIDTDCRDKIFGGKAGIPSYSRARWLVTIPLTYDFQYSVTSSLNVEVMDKDLYKDLDEDPEQVESQYSGGPAKLALWTQSQPIRNDSTSYGKVTVTNTGKGKIPNGTEVSAYFNLPEGITMTNIAQASAIGMEDCNLTVKQINCKLSDSLRKDDNANIFFKFDILLEGAKQKTFTITGEIESYNYTGSKDIELPIASSTTLK
jgi:hypothetical protein